MADSTPSGSGERGEARETTDEDPTEVVSSPDDAETTEVPVARTTSGPIRFPVLGSTDPTPTADGPEGRDDRILRGPVAAAGLPVALLGLAPGAALLVALIAALPLGVALLITVGVAVLAAAVAWLRAEVSRRAALRRRTGIGAVAGLAGVVAFDAVRGTASAVPELVYEPYTSLEVLGAMLVGEAAAEVVLTGGIVLHGLIGVGFGVAFTLALRRPGVLAGLVYGLVLASFLVVVYPNWIGVEGVFDAFLVITLVAHVAFGVVVGLVARWLVGRAGPRALLG